VSRIHSSPRNAAREAIEENIEHRCRKKGEKLTDKKTSNHGDAQRVTQFCSDSGAKGQWNPREQRTKRGHHNRTESQPRRLEDRLFCRLVFLSLGRQSKIDDQNSVLLNDAD